MTRILRRLVKWFYLAIALLLILFAVLVQSGRSFSYLVTDHQQKIADYLSKKLDAKVSIQQLQMDWQGLKPGIELRHVQLHSAEGQPIVSFDHAMMRLDILRSLRNFSLVWNDLSIEKVNIRFQQQADGFWKIPGWKKSASPSSTKNQSNFDPLIDTLLLSHHMSVRESNLVFEFNNQKTLSLVAPNLLLENKGNFHRLSLQVDIENQPRSLYLLVEAKGDPRNTKRLNAQAYLELNEFPTSEPLQAAMSFLLSGQKSHLSSEGNLSAKIWMDSREAGEGFNLTGELNLQRLVVEIQQRHLALDQFSVDLVGHWLFSGKWNLGLQNIHAQLASEKIENTNLVASSNGFKQAVQLRLDHLDLQQTHQLLDRAGIVGEDRLKNTLNGLQPKGHLSQLQLTLPYQDTKNWQLAARLQQVSVEASQGVPGLASVDGYVQAGAKGGFISIDSRNGFSMFFPTVYQEPMQYDRMSGQVAWHLQKDNNQVYVNSGALHFYQGDEHTTGYMWLSMPWIKGTANVDLALQIQSEQLNPSLYKKYTPKTLSPNLLEWLSKSIGEKNPGTAKNIGFVYRASLNIKEPYGRSFQLAMHLENAALKYHADWPEIKQLTGSFRVDDARIYADINKAQLFATQIDHAQLEMYPKKNSTGSLLSINATMNGSASDGLRILREGALRRYIGNSIDSWFMSGNIKTKLDLIIPVGTSDQSDALQQVESEVDAPVFEIRNLNLQTKDLKGKIIYNSKTGLSSENLQAILFNEPINAHLTTIQQDEQRRTRVNIEGAIDTDALTKWTQRPETQFLKGRMPYQLTIDLKHNNKTAEDDSAVKGVLQSSNAFINDAFAEITLTSDLRGVAVDLPKPYGKKAGSKRPLTFNLWLQPHYSQIRATYDGKVDSLFRLQRGEHGRLLNANIALSNEAKFASDDGVHASEFLVSGYLGSFDLDSWKTTQQRYNQYQQTLTPKAESSDQPDEIAGLPFKANINLGEYELGKVKFQDVNVIATPSESGWNLLIDNPKVQGKVNIPRDSALALNLDLQYLYLDTNESLKGNDSSSITPQEKVDPRKLPLADIRVEELFIDGEAWGDLGFEIRPNSQGVLIDNIQGTLRGMSMHHQQINSRGAQLFWQVNEQGDISRFAGRLTAKNMADVLRQWKKPEMVESSNAELKVDVNWLSAPQDFHLVDIAGLIEINLNEGRFHREATAGDGLLRLMSILNFDSLARRLRLDFSDLYKTGLAYEQISGKVSFDRGTMTFVEPLVVRSPSSDLQMAGSLNLRDETINTRIVANLPVAGNLTFYAALATGLPAAAGVYLVSKIFKKQVNQFASVSYTMTGSWEKPKVKFDRLFESEDSLRKKTDTEKSTKEKQPDLSFIFESNPYLKPTMGAML